MNIKELVNILTYLHPVLDGADIQEVHALFPQTGVRIFGYRKDSSFFEKVYYFPNKPNLSLVEEVEV